MVYNALRYSKRLRFTLAHEYGHVKLNHTGESIYDSVYMTLLSLTLSTQEKNLRSIHLQEICCFHCINATNIGGKARMK
ncbi:ImmA/IrrE family metallo-endopeptidase [bacterium M00.F.Ca.ET.180.01.1.1]|nr:ImmA/IrrE family metallo-endopeptidase [bacterium M00.F.Ca.ET.229.01.1.1]TGS39385.1 ImmA/IrrE family metallo-endopeptidase [bacterium M00.F.Ca.ET.180.01.1.1]